MTLQAINLEDYNYSLAEHRIAKYPLHQRDQSKRLIYRDHQIREDVFKHIPTYLDKDSLLVFNNTKVIHARVTFFKSTGAKIEIFCLEPFLPKNYTDALNSSNECTWKCFVGNAKKWKNNVLTKQIFINGKETTLSAEKTEQQGQAYIIRFRWNPVIPFYKILNENGAIPIPPYLKRESEETDKERYQTIYSNIEGSVAAPTAGLHFTQEILKNKNINTEKITLHIGAGTFTPVKTPDITEHPMHTERYYITADSLSNIMHYLKNIIAVGTTTLRCLESLYWTGVKISQSPSGISSAIHLDQWEHNELPQDIPVLKALKSIQNYMHKHKMDILEASTRIMIIPGYQFRIPRVLITNFHQPKSTLLMLIAAFIGEDWKSIYSYALAHDFRFLSYGDSNLLFTNQQFMI